MEVPEFFLFLSFSVWLFLSHCEMYRMCILLHKGEQKESIKLQCLAQKENKTWIRHQYNYLESIWKKKKKKKKNKWQIMWAL